MKKIISLILLILTVLSSTACTFVKIPAPENPETLDSVILAQSVNLGTLEETDRQILSTEDAVYKTERAVVAIRVQPIGSDSASFGSGVIVKVEDRAVNEYYILTCHHVIESMGNVRVYVPDENRRNYTDADYDPKYAFSGTIGASVYPNSQISLVGGDKESDVAVLKLTLPVINNLSIEEVPVPVDNYTVRKGAEVFAIGNPTGSLPNTFTKGYVSYVNRTASFIDIGTLTLLQLNTDIWRGSSGGALFNMYGELIGLTNGGRDLDLENEACYSGINYAIPYEIDGSLTENGFINVARQLIGTATETNYGYVSGRKSKLGFVSTYQPETGILSVTAVTENSISAKAGLLAGDVILSANGTPTTDNAVLSSVISSLSVGDQLTLSISRNNGLTIENKQISMTIAQYRFCDTGL